MTAANPARLNVIAVLVATAAALIVRAWLQVQLLASGVQKYYAADLSYLVVPPILVFLLFPVLYRDKAFLMKQFRVSGVSLGAVLGAVAVGVLLRALWWSSVTAGISFGFIGIDNPQATAGPVFTFQCAAPHVVALGFLVMTIFVPIIEELTHRAYVQTYLYRHGPIIAILVASLVFAFLHPLASWPFAFLAGLVFGVQYFNSGSLWPALISHATVNALIQIDWRCLNGTWNPPVTSLPLWAPGTIATLVIVVSAVGILWLIGKRRGG